MTTSRACGDRRRGAAAAAGAAAVLGCAAAAPRSSIMKPSSRRAGTARRGAVEQSRSAPSVASGSADQPHLAALRHRVDDAGGVEQPRLQAARRFALLRRRDEHAAFGATSRIVCRRALREHAALVHHEDVRAALGLVEVGGAHDHRQALARRTSPSTISHSSRRDSGSTPTVGSSSSSSSGEPHQRAGQAELLLHAAGELAREALGERPEVGHLP